MPTMQRLSEALAAGGFTGRIEQGPATSVVYGTDNSIYQLRPIGALVPDSFDDLVLLADVNHRLEVPHPLVARGGGTGTNGQSLTDGVVVDLRRTMNRILSIDADAMTAVVEPGVVLGQLNAAVASHGLFFAPHTSTSTRCTIGGMVATDAAGKGSLVHGRTNHHVQSIDAVLADGTPWSTARMTGRATMETASRPDRVGALHRAIVAALDGFDRRVLPDVPRGFTGYNLADTLIDGDGRDDGGASDPAIDPTKLLCGSEGTLALIGAITVRLTPLASETLLAVATYSTFEAAVRDANRLKVTNPTAIECLDQRTISLASRSPAWNDLRALIDVDGRAVLLLEYHDRLGLDRVGDLIAEPGSEVTALATSADPATIAAVWTVRADAVGLLGQPVGGRRSIAFVEDCAVPPHRLDEFVSAFRTLLDRHGVGYGMFGHADVGCVHVRPTLDLLDPADEALVRTISDDVAELVGRFGGVMWGEHGRGFRGEYLDLPDDVVHRMRLIKTAFDPADLLNPGKLYTPLTSRDAAVTRIDAVPLRAHSDRTVAVGRRHEFESAFSCNGNGICHHWGEAEVMCPSFKVTLDPRLSPKGRADLVRAWLASPDDASLAGDLAASMHDCLSCGACTGRCPLQVDIPELKSRFLEQHREPDRRRRLRQRLVGRFEPLLGAVARAGPVGYPLQRLTAPLLRRAVGLVDLPLVPPGTLASRAAGLGVPMIRPGDPADDVSVIILTDAFTALLDPSVMEAAVVVLRAIGERPAITPFVPSGKFDHVVGRRRHFALAVARQRGLVESYRDLDATLVVIEPAVALLANHEYLAIDPSFPSAAVRSLAGFLAERVDRLPLGSARDTVQLFDHCTESSLAPGDIDAYRSMLERVGHTVEHEQTGCCGMAGIFGHEIEHLSMSTALFERSWGPRLESDRFTRRCASGYSCRSQAQRFGFGSLQHPVQVVAAALDP
ncbi:MAG: FAD-binding and (Fe-S)-binding domain-containing protein [Ilumatobacteraceae bacterium]